MKIPKLIKNLKVGITGIIFVLSDTNNETLTFGINKAFELTLFNELVKNLKKVKMCE